MSKFSKLDLFNVNIFDQNNNIASEKDIVFQLSKSLYDSIQELNCTSVENCDLLDPNSINQANKHAVISFIGV